MSILIDAFKITLIVLMGLSGIVGLLALISPHLLVAASSFSNKNIIRGMETRLDKRWFDIDRFVHAHSRVFGVLVIGMVGYLWFISSHGPVVYSKSSMLIIVAVSLIMGVVALSHMMIQRRTIESHLAQANTDPLTGIANRRAFDVELSRRLAQWQRQGIPLCLMIIDVDDFKVVNDNYGHPMGDATLKKLGRDLGAILQQMDIVARLGGDEFAVILPGSTLEEASGAAERLRKAIADSSFRYEENEQTLTVSIGLAEAQLGDDAASLIKRSDAALYAAKEAGKNCCFRQGSPEPTVAAPC